MYWHRGNRNWGCIVVWCFIISVVVDTLSQWCEASDLYENAVQNPYGQLNGDVVDLSDHQNVSVTTALNPLLSRSQRRRRDIFHLYSMMSCTTNCDPLSYKGYGCYCGFLGSGTIVDAIDNCCMRHDSCYSDAPCSQALVYFVPYKWKCNGGSPYCVTQYYEERKAKDICGHHLCECDRQFAECLRHYPCPSKKAVCVTNPWRSLG